MKIALLKAGIDPNECLNGFEYQEFALSKKAPVYPNELRAAPPEGLIDYDLFIADTKGLNVIDAIVLDSESKNIHDAIRNGGVLVCFASGIVIFNEASKFNNYSWLPKRVEINSNLIENFSASIILTQNQFPFTDFLNKNKEIFSSECFLKPDLGNMAYNIILTDKGGRAVGLFRQEQKGYIFIFPRVSNKEKFIRSFIYNILSTIPTSFQLEPFSVTKIPDYAIKYLEGIPGIDEINKEIKMAEGEILKAQEKKKNTLDKKSELEKWIGLVYLKDIPLQRIVGDAFDFLEIKTERPPETENGPDLRLKEQSKEIIVEIEGSKNSITIDKGRQLYHWLGEEKSDVKGLLVGNPFNDQLIENRPPSKDKSLFTKDLKDFAEARGFSILLSTDLFNLVCRKLKGEKIDPQKLFNDIYEKKGIIIF